MACSLQTRTESLTKLQWWLAGGLAAFAVGFFLFFYRPAEQKRDALKQAFERTAQELAVSRARASDLPRLSSENEELAMRLARSKRIPKQSEWADLVRDITRLSNQSSLKKFTYKYGLAQRHETYSQLPIMLDFEGDMMDVYAFVRQIEELPRLTRLRGITINAGEKTGSVRVQMALNTYFSMEP